MIFPEEQEETKNSGINAASFLLLFSLWLCTSVSSFSSKKGNKRTMQLHLNKTSSALF